MTKTSVSTNLLKMFFVYNSWDWETTCSITKINVRLVQTTSSTSSQLSSTFTCQLQMHQKPSKPRRLLSRKVGQICYRTVNVRVCFGPDTPGNTNQLGLVCRSVGSGSRAAERSSLPVWKSVWWSRAWGLLLPQPVGQSGLPAGEGSWGAPATFYSCMNTLQYSSSTATLVFTSDRLFTKCFSYVFICKLLRTL